MIDTAGFLGLLRREGDRLAAMPADALGAPVPTVEGWTLERVVRHVGKVHRWVVAAVEAGPDGAAGHDGGLAPLEPLPKGPACLDAYAEALDAVVAALAARDPAEPAWTFRGPGDVAFWARRQAHEVAVHRIDAADAVAAAGGAAPDPLDPTGAADGLDELLDVFVRPHWRSRGEPPPERLRGTYRFRPTDVDTDAARRLVIAGAVTVAPDGARHRAGTGASDAGQRSGAGPEEASTGAPDERPSDGRHVVATGSAEALLLALWRRRPLDALAVDGDADLLAALVHTVRI